MLTKYQVNQSVLFLALFFFVTNLLNLNSNSGLLRQILQFVLSILCLHYMCNCVHLASHQLLSKNRRLNHIFGWCSALPVLVFSFIDFWITHNEHHKHPADDQLDPDHKITNSGSIFTLPFRIMYFKDGFFLKKAWQKKNWRWIFDYGFQRLIQLGITGFIIYQSIVEKNQTLVIFYVLPLILVGILNALFLYYYPHYQNWIEFWARRNVEKNILAKAILWTICLSRSSHHAHHKQIQNNTCYYLEYWFLFNKIDFNGALAQD